MIKKMLNKYKRYRKRKYIPENPRHDDIYLVSYPKSGNTWVSFLIANVITQYLELDIDINFNTVRDFIPDIHMCRDIPKELSIFPFRRIIKSHTSYNLYYNTIFLLVRNPKDVMVSYYHYLTNLNEYHGTLSEFVYDEEYGVDKWINHTKSWLEKVKPSQRLYIISYEDLKNDTKKEIDKMFKIMGFDVKEEVLEAAVKRSHISNMKEIEKYSGGYSFFKNNKFKFVRKGKTGEGKEKLSLSEINYIEEKCNLILEKINSFNNKVEGEIRK